MVVERLQGALPGVAQHHVHAALGLAGVDRDAERLGLAQLGRHLGQHGDAAGAVKAADNDRYIGLAELTGEIQGARKLVGLDSDQANQAAAGSANALDDLLAGNYRVGLVHRLELNLDILAEHLVLRALGDQAVDRRQRVRGDRRAKPLNDVTVVVIVRWLNQDDKKSLGGAHGLTLRFRARTLKGTGDCTQTSERFLNLRPARAPGYSRTFTTT